MNSLIITSTSTSPTIHLDALKGELLLEGRSIPENSRHFYKPAFEWLDEYNKKPQLQTTLTINLEYFNTSSSDCLITILRKIKSLAESGNSVKIIWQYHTDDDDIKEAGQTFSEIIDLPFEFVEQY